MPATLQLPVQDRSQVGEARRLACAWAAKHGSSQQQQGKLALIVSELANNLALHTTEGGKILVQVLVENDPTTLEVLALDNGPGSANFTAFLQDGFSTTGTAGTGLGAVQRGSSLFEMHSNPQTGTALLSQQGEGHESNHAHFGMINVPIRGEHVCGDSLGYLDLGGGRQRLMVADGLGHGPLAADASLAAIATFKSNPHLDLISLLQKVHTALKSTRGAAVAVAEVDANTQKLLYAGVGNIAGSIVHQVDEYSHLVSMNGTLGMACGRIQQFSYAWQPESLLVMTSDGVKNHWRLDRYPGLINRHPSLIAGVLFRDYARDNDDATAAVLRFSV
ncbi:serine/threonine protein kinase [Phragmitibacter flavus]|uniref:Serine/threonine protein kinase n=1 Tax=Phragmitibacter flavus TaxID=2576071 RepID=A0A5R8KI56_9BACT|nr:SpoIIE family protein phosphatase [Phragmitibacter flavus]TLD71947.1 serine/threonine protein kinase [Phragmitibacter flavus]